MSLAKAEAKVSFHVVPPAGVPSDARLEEIATVGVLVYDKRQKLWSKDWPALSFTYRRTDGREFGLMAERDDARTGPPSNHMWLAEDLPGGKVALTKYARFSWVNGDQMMSVTTDGLTAAEIEAIRAAMHGQPVVHNATESIERRYTLEP